MKRPFNGTFPITQEWGVNPDDYARFGLKGHNGVDYGTPTGTPILAPHNGKVIESAYDQYGYGMYVKIENEKEGSILGHLKSFNVNTGDTVFEGQQIGISNNTGNSTGPHLHWGYYRMPRNKSDGYSGTTNPYPYLSENNSQVDDCPAKLAEKTALETELRGVITKKDTEIEELKATLSNLNSTIEAKNRQIADLEGSSKQLAEQLKDCQFSLQSKTEQASKLPECENLTLEQEKKINLLKDEIESKNRAIAQYKSRWDMMKWSLKKIIVEKVLPLLT